jgi:RND family efflux transporter MFP subunit
MVRLGAPVPKIAALAACLAVATIADGHAVSLTVDQTQCAVRPRQVIQLGSPVFSVLSDIYVDRSSQVKKGDVVAKLNSTVEEAQLALDRFRAYSTTAIETAKSELAYDQRELNRRQQLAGNMFSKANEIDEMTTKADQVRIAIRKAEDDQRLAALEADRSQRQLELRLIRSPTDGVVTEVKLRPGEYVYETTPIVTIIQIDPLKVDLVAPAEYYGTLKVGMTAQVELLSPLNITRPAEIDAIDPQIDVATDTFRIRLNMPNSDGAIPAGVRCAVKFRAD